MKMAYAPVQRYVPICDLNVNITHSKVVGVIIGKSDSRGFPDRKNVGSERFTFSFTVKDSPEHFINVSAWGKEEYIQGLSSRFQIGDCVVIENPLVVTKDYEKEERFCPSTSSAYRLLLTETHSSIRICSDLETEARILPLFHMPIKDPRDFYSLGDITANGQSLDGHIINILAALQSVGEEKFFSKSDGRKGQRLEIKLLDDTGTSFPLVCWDKETIRLVQRLTPRETVLFIADTRITFDSFRSCMIATATSKTIITVNPDTAEANQLYTRIRELSEAGGLDDQDILSVDSITDALTVNQLKTRSQEHADVFHCITYGFITTLNVCSSISKVIRKKCAKCKFRISEEIQTCSNDACPIQGQPLQATTGFDLLLDISDHTGTVQSCNLAGTVAEKTLGCKTEEFLCLSESERISLQWKFLVERCKIYLKVLPSPKSYSGMRARILSCALADPVEVKQYLASVV
ncbi:meiosis-specific with OB domain-containing protein isoform X2 [Pimephales promelas]|uniref:meiosis-specific with OB domain-containing protein isoform X2 n=1 Tax=Pimephales promelas TaxID=90988 RepID=UPI001955DE86|nr:meiosis-specific with OB domain-containing protein isoform X2 [Pimephales promelas]KAG1925473.1 meiosis-specific with OB domain-containing protein [Pimephales promelas]